MVMSGVIASATGAPYKEDARYIEV